MHNREQMHDDNGLREQDLDLDPIKQFRAWLDQVLTAQLAQPYGMTLATSTADGRPSARMVLLRGLDERGFCFFTNYESRKGQELQANSRAALVFYWPELERQVRIEGSVEVVSAEESDAYWQTRPYGSQISACASRQSEILLSRDVLEQRVQELAAKYPEGKVPRPPHWGGYRVVPESIEFWEGQPNRLHDRLRYLRLEQGGWLLERLAP